MSEQRIPQTVEELTAVVEDKSWAGGLATGANASPWDFAYYAAQAVFPQAGDAQHRLMADYVVASQDERDEDEWATLTGAK